MWGFSNTIMKKLLLIILLIIILVYIFFFDIVLSLVSEKEKDIDTYVNDITEYISVKRPESAGPHPVLVIIPGCLGRNSHNNNLDNFFLDLGYAVVDVDSINYRGISVEDYDRLVCESRKLTGTEIAGDIYATLEYLDRQDWVEKNKVTIAGWSYGGWATIDALYFATKKRESF